MKKNNRISPFNLALTTPTPVSHSDNVHRQRQGGHIILQFFSEEIWRIFDMKVEKRTWLFILKQLKVQRQNSTTAKEVVRFQHLVPYPSWLM